MDTTVTGANGFIGRNLTKALVDAGHRVVAVVRRPEKRALLEGVGATAAVRSLEDEAGLAEAFRDAEVVFHLANVMVFALPSVQWATNVEGTRRVLAAARRAGVRRLVYASSVAVYGHAQEATEEAPRRPVTHYGRTKVAVEDLLRAHADGLEVQILRPGVVYGPGAPLLYHLCRRGPALVGPGTNWVPLVHVVDVVRALVRAGQAREVAPAVNVVDDVPLRMRDFLARVADGCGRSLRRVPVPLAYGAALLAETAARLRGATPRLTRDVLRLYRTSVTATNDRLTEALGVSLRHPDSRGPLADALEAVSQPFAL